MGYLTTSRPFLPPAEKNVQGPPEEALKLFDQALNPPLKSTEPARILVETLKQHKKVINS